MATRRPRPGSGRSVFARHGPTGTFLEHCGTRLHLALPSDDVGLAPGALVVVGAPTHALSGIFLPSLRRFRVLLPPGRPDVIDATLGLRNIYVHAMAGSGGYNV